jgi:hypothetical protein
VIQTVCFKRGDQREEGAELYRKYKQQFGRDPHWRAAPDFSVPIPGLGLTITVIDDGHREHYWWEDRLRARGWLGMELGKWMRICSWAEKHGSADLLQELLTD